MIVRYYKIGSMAYATRQRYIDISKFEYYKEEDNRSVRLGNGANTFVKTNIADVNEPRHVTYVTIEDTRWFVTDFVYLNGKQVQFNLQRDVVGEFGLGSAYGKIERGYTDSVLKYRKELSLNEVLTKRIPLKSFGYKFGNLRVDGNDNEMWGILYFTKDSTKEKVSINIPAFEPAYEIDNPPEINKNYRDGEIKQYMYFTADLFVGTSAGHKGVRFIYQVYYRNSSEFFSYINYGISSCTANSAFLTALAKSGTSALWLDGFVDMIIRYIKDYLDQNLATNGFKIPTAGNVFGLTEAPANSDGKVYKEGSEYYRYSKNSKVVVQPGTYVVSDIVSGLIDYITTQNPQWSIFNNLSGFNDGNSEITVDAVSYTRSLIPHSEAGIIDVSMTQQLVDEPYCILVFPLYSVNLTIDGQIYSISKVEAFNIFNEVVSSLSGENPFLIDAQIYPYCPQIDKVQTTLKTASGSNYPFMSVLSTSFETRIPIGLRPFLDVKKEYITRSYSIVSPDQSNKFNFNFYDYVNNFEEGLDGRNRALMEIIVKTALKPFSIISSAVIKRENSLKGLNYESNLEGSQSASGGFECSLASDAFETYKRQNSNYQQLFDIDRNELRKSQEVERVNESTQFAMNMITGTAFGAIAGASLADAGLANLVGSKAIGAGVGAGASAATIGAFGGVQLAKNDELRAYEREIQQQRYDLTLGTIKNLPNSVNRISSFNEIIMKNFYYVVEVYECTSDEMQIVDNFIENYGYGIGVFDFLSNYQKNNWFLKASVTKSDLPITLHQIFKYDIEGGVYINE